MFKIHKKSGDGLVYISSHGMFAPGDLVASQNVDSISIFQVSNEFYLFSEVDYTEFVDGDDNPFASANALKAYLDGLFVENTYVTDIADIQSDLASLTSSDITDFSEAVDDRVGTLIQAGSGININYDDSGNALTISSTGGFTSEDAQDAVGGALQDTASVNLTYNDAGNTITADVIPSGVDHDQLQNFVANEHVDHSSVSVNAGAGLTGGGDLTATRTISMPNVGTAGTYGSASDVPVVTTDSQGRVSNVVSTPISITASQVSDFTEAVQDAVAPAFVDSASVDFTYNDGANTVTAAVLPAGVDHDALQNFVANEHIDHSSVSINPGTGLSGGGDITTSRTLNIANTGVSAGTYGSVNQVPQITVNAQGQLTSVTPLTIKVPQIAFLSSDISTTSGTPVNATGLSFSVAANTRYKFKFLVAAASEKANRAVRFTITTPASPTVFSAFGSIAQNTDGTNVFYTGLINTSGDQILSLSVPNANQLSVSVIEGILVTGASAGNIQLQYWNESSGTQALLAQGSMGELWTLA